jgi:hypothetical protein
LISPSVRIDVEKGTEGLKHDQLRNWLNFNPSVHFSINKYVTLDLLKLSISAGSDITITGKLDGCNSISDWSGGGKLKAGLEAKGEVAVKTPGKVIVIEH